jgi:hypothetical protein
VLSGSTTIAAHRLVEDVVLCVRQVTHTSTVPTQCSTSIAMLLCYHKQIVFAGTHHCAKASAASNLSSLKLL